MMALSSVASLTIPGKTFSADNPLFCRDADNGTNKPSYFLGKLLICWLPEFLLLPYCSGRFSMS
jgi:hypothetical protein